MTIGIEQFRNLAQSVDANQSIVLANKGTGVKDRGGFATAFTFKSTHRAATQAFLDSYRAAYGANLGEIAREMVQNDLNAGKPLRASTVNQLIDLAEAKTAHFRMGVASFLAQDNARLAAIVDEIAASKYPNATAAQKQAAVMVIAMALPGLSLVVLNETGSQAVEHNIERAIKEMKTPLLKAGLEMVFNATGSRPASAGGAGADVNVKTQALGLITNHGRFSFDVDTPAGAMAVNLLLTAACKIPAGQDGRVEVTQAKLYAALFPQSVFTDAKCAELGMTRHAAAELDLMSRTDFAAAISDNLAKLSHDSLVNHLPANSPFRYPKNSSTGILKAESGFMPADIVGKNAVTPLRLADVSMIHCDNGIESLEKYPTTARAVDMFKGDAARLGQVGHNANSPSPTWHFSDSDGMQLLNTRLGFNEYQANNQAAEATADSIVNTVDRIAASDAQKRVIMVSLTQTGIYPLWHTVQSMGGYAKLSEHSHYDYTVAKQADGSVNVTVSIGAELTPSNGTGSITYNIDTNGKSTVTDFQWDPPNKRAALNDFLTNNQRSYDTIAGAINKMGIKGDETIDYCTRFLADDIHLHYDGIADDQLPTLSQLTDEITSGRIGLPDVKALVNSDVKMAKAMEQMTPATRRLFAESIRSIDTTYDLSLTPPLMQRLPQLAEMKAAHPEMTIKELTWRILFDEPLPEGYENLQGFNMSNVAWRRGINMLTTMLQEARQRYAPPGTDVPPPAENEIMGRILPMIMSELPAELAVEILANPQKPTQITIDDLVPQSVYAYVGMNDNTMDKVKWQIEQDLHRRGTHGRALGASQSSRLNLQFQGQTPLAVNLSRPEGMGEEELQEYKGGKPTSLSHDIVEQFRAACGGNETQAKAAAICIAQSGAGYLRNLIPSTVARPEDGLIDEHSAAICTCTKDDAGNINVRWQNCPESIIRFDFNYQIAPDGRQTLTNFVAERV